MSGEPAFFDDSLPRLVDVVADTLGADAVSSGTVVRDASGRLAFFAAYELDEDTKEILAARIRDAIGVYARKDRVVAGRDDLGAGTILQDASALRHVVGGRTVRVLDRRIVGADWLRSPAPAAEGPPRFVFTSMKGGVGRSTALAIVAAHLASRGGRVLVVDLDLEAPGLGAFLLDAGTTPPFGMIDALVECNLRELDTFFLSDLVGPSSLAPQGGRINVVPAFGGRSLKHPADVLAKLSRAYTEAIRPDGTMQTFLDKVRGVLDRLAPSSEYDAVLIDARAGLHESTAASVLGLGADVFLFALDEPQTYAGYPALLAHLARFAPASGSPPEWLERLSTVQAKASVDPSARQSFADRWRAMTDEFGPVPMSSEPLAVPLPDGFRDVPWDDDAPDSEVLPRESTMPEPLVVLEDKRFAGFAPLERRDQIAEAVYRDTFGSLIERFESAVLPQEELG